MGELKYRGDYILIMGNGKYVDESGQPTWARALAHHFNGITAVLYVSENKDRLPGLRPIELNEEGNAIAYPVLI